MGMFQGNSGDNSSKRIIGFIIIVWVMVIGTVYFFYIQTGGKESVSIDNILQTLGCGALATISAGVVEQFGNNNKKQP